MRIHITGEVVDGMTEENGMKYHISADGTQYEVIPRGGQAFKDYLFVRKHQQIEVEGILKAKQIFLEKARIRLKEKKREEKTENNISDREGNTEKR